MLMLMCVVRMHRSEKKDYMKRKEEKHLLFDTHGIRFLCSEPLRVGDMSVDFFDT
jgi:hypothetical protein